MIKHLKPLKNSCLWGSRVKHFSLASCEFTALNVRVLMFVAVPVAESSDCRRLHAGLGYRGAIGV